MNGLENIDSGQMIAEESSEAFETNIRAAIKRNLEFGLSYEEGTRGNPYARDSKF